jgi:Ni/Fe-hydrogenase subunit HybB-like protein
MFTLGLIVAIVIFICGLSAGSFIQNKTSWPWK